MLFGYAILSTKDGIAEKFFLFKIKVVVIYSLLIILKWQSYQH